MKLTFNIDNVWSLHDIEIEKTNAKKEIIKRAMKIALGIAIVVGLPELVKFLFGALPSIAYAASMTLMVLGFFALLLIAYPAFIGLGIAIMFPARSSLVMPYHLKQLSLTDRKVIRFLVTLNNSSLSCSQREKTIKYIETCMSERRGVTECELRKLDHYVSPCNTNSATKLSH